MVKHKARHIKTNHCRQSVIVRKICRMVFEWYGSRTSCADRRIQQKFFFELFSDSKVNAVCGKGFYTKLDLGIVKYHFEIASGRKLQS